MEEAKEEYYQCVLNIGFQTLYERQKYLENILTYGLADVEELVSYLADLISENAGNVKMKRSLDIWKEDLIYMMEKLGNK